MDELLAANCSALGTDTISKKWLYLCTAVRASALPAFLPNKLVEVSREQRFIYK